MASEKFMGMQTQNCKEKATRKLVKPDNWTGFSLSVLF
jgi:hypothetical protein